ncbi:MAG: 50S ribosomal protein L30 [Ruoffia tabacinasalis]|jgi:large subunit ribosomal protein L30|uniref:Large ribosomal subunit protein uL30 n=2 Tax=Ruoffia TaxID=2862144 RepID=A0A839A6H2_9LACT|nr:MULTISPECIES: 50S ribosomal protein L30 [Ruoffia]HBY89623.1 50S ribosomal protein L30 [Aerococcaceae bacterium]MBA5729866.1 50S ribosomal protein L30 [Ruoffia halotolerans]MBG9977468.1 50S ribosomal protein L30 [Ruoffia tabacinasalis]TLQ41587.1 50S ribosomal protein L30 [Ruoffia tabacinasalis]HJG48091.1 50S ribosomal protein L30 [Ruoffia tabacinasalis]
MANLEITLKRSFIGRKQNQIQTAKALGLTKLNKSVVKPDNESVRGMVRTISHLVEVKEA